jgi:hypothetical protein
MQSFGIEFQRVLSFQVVCLSDFMRKFNFLYGPIDQEKLIMLQIDISKLKQFSLHDEQTKSVGQYLLQWNFINKVSMITFFKDRGCYNHFKGNGTYHL